METDMEQLYTPEILAHRLALARQTIYNRVNTGGDLPPYFRLGRTLRWRPEDVEAWIDMQRQVLPVVVASPVPSPRKRGRPRKEEVMQAMRR